MKNNIISNRAWKVIFWALLLFTALGAQAQEKPDTLVLRSLDNAKRLMDKGDYKGANQIFLRIFKTESTLPDELVYFYGKTLYKLDKFNQSKSVLGKYLELTGTSGKYYKESIDILNKLGEKICPICNNKGYLIDTIACTYCKGSGTRNVDCSRCNASGKELCPTCKGSKVLVTGTPFGAKFTPCTHCNQEGYVLCEKCKGSTKEKAVCVYCSGEGHFHQRRTCTHVQPAAKH
ncbi:MAG: hypothetical protein K2Q22_14590 [Cytophagales bacterium]|nr:hypothetical protein [Cytophagales bacterium]